MVDERRLYMKQLLRNYKQSIFDIPVAFTITYTTHGCEEHNRLISNNEGIDMAIDYIDELERKVDELKHVEKIINLAKENNYDK